MCGRFVLEAPADKLVHFYQLPSCPEITPRYNIAPSQEVATIRQSPAGKRELAFCKWGLIPSWAKDPKIGYKMINARSETAHEKPSFRKALQIRRCIIPASGFYEWEKVGKEKRPYYISSQEDALLSFAGLWETWTTPKGNVVESCTILTTDANDMIKQVHLRMPVVLDNDGVNIWLNQESTQDDLKPLFRPLSGDLMALHRVSPKVNSPKYDQPGGLDPI